MDYLPTNAYTERRLTQKQVDLLDNLPSCNFDPIKAAIAAGYTEPYVASRALRKEITALAEETISNTSLKALKTLIDVLDNDAPTMNLKEKIAVAQDLLDRAGHAKKQIMEVNHEIKGGVFILPDKKPVNFIEGDYEDV